MSNVWGKFLVCLSETCLWWQDFHLLFHVILECTEQNSSHVQLPAQVALAFVQSGRIGAKEEK